MSEIVRRAASAALCARKFGESCETLGNQARTRLPADPAPDRYERNGQLAGTRAEGFDPKRNSAIAPFPAVGQQQAMRTLVPGAPGWKVSFRVQPVR